MTTRILFTCPHAAGKSLLAATYFRAAATRLGLHVDVAVAGPDPGAENMADVAAALRDQGYVIGWHPKLIDRRDTEAADMIVSIGCELGSIPTSKPVTEWDVPMLSDDFGGCMSAIHAHTEQLAASIAAR